jgi:hypothetical protein
MRYKNLTQIWNVAMDKPTLDLALRFADTETYDLLRGIGVSMNAASAACDDMLKDVARYYQQPSMTELLDHMED